ncbi:TolC family protein [Ruminiclostridium herbifermentans]|uniref:TolC family protein n=1 Tax=Ruminiclostridium herbifermentans TaxID=2488810 RepID=A0A4U7JAG2_9FIRM|nr:TolC family protein [Ruminiclostridium herbifermentans]QNU66811.1 TolC family protein [Ruminiclostridium herbifermentans]
MQKRKLAGLLLTFSVVVSLFSPVFAVEQEVKAEPIVLSLEVAQQKAVENDNSIIKTNRTIKNLIENNDYTYKEGLFDISDAADSIDDLYNRLKNGRAMNSQEYGKLCILYTMYGDTEYFSGKEDLTKYMNPNRFAKYSLWANVMKLSLSNQITEDTIRYQTRVLYDNILSIQGQLENFKRSVELQEKMYKQQKSRYDVGELSKVTIDTAYKQLQISRLEVNKLTRTIDNLEMDLKRLIGLPIDSQIVLSDYSKNNIEKLEDYDTYLNRALINRNEILLAKINYGVAKNEAYTVNEAYSNNPWNVSTQLNKSFAEQKINEAELSISISKETVLQSINTAYIDAKYKKEEMDICKAKLNYENEQYRITSEKYKNKLISETELKNREIGKLSALTAYNDAVRAYNLSVTSLQQASGLGIASMADA